MSLAPCGLTALTTDELEVFGWAPGQSVWAWNLLDGRRVIPTRDVDYYGLITYGSVITDEGPSLAIRVKPRPLEERSWSKNTTLE